MQDKIYHLLTEEYTITLATTDEDFKIIKSLRKEIFAPKYNLSPEILEEKGYLFSKDDIQSFNYLLHHNPSNTYVGTVRVFFINDKTPHNRLPMQYDGNVNDIDHLTQNIPICEISRLALSNNLPSYCDFSALQLRTSLTMGLMVAIRLNCLLYKYTEVFNVMEKSLARILKRQDASFQVIGKPIEYYGMRIPHSIKRKQLLHDTEEKGGRITLFYLKQLCRNSELFWNFIDNNPYLERSDMQLDNICKLLKENGNNITLSQLLDEDNVLCN